MAVFGGKVQLVSRGGAQLHGRGQQHPAICGQATAIGDKGIDKRGKLFGNLLGVGGFHFIRVSQPMAFVFLGESLG